MAQGLIADRQRIARVTERTLAWRFGQWYWGDAIAVDGVIAAARLIPSLKSAKDAIVQSIEHWSATAPPAWDDALVSGRAVFRLVADGAVSDRVAERTLVALRRLPRNPHGVPLIRPHVPEWRQLVWVDSLYHLPAAMAAVGRYRPDDPLVDEAAGVAERTVALLEHPAGLAHAYDGGLQVTNGVAWSRGLGWALLGVLDLLDELVAVGRTGTSRLQAIASRLLARLADSQRTDGHWPTVLDDPAARWESSTAAFFLAAALHAQAPRLADVGVDASTLSRAAAAVDACIDEDGCMRHVSVDTHVRWERDAYREPLTAPSPWAQGCALRALLAVAARNPTTIRFEPPERA